MDDQAHITGLFVDEEGTIAAIARIRCAGLEPEEVFAPFPSEQILHALGRRTSPVRAWVLLGGVCGCATGFALTIGLSAEYPHVTGGMPIVSIPPFVIIAFELTILFGALSGLLGFLVHGRFPCLTAPADYDPRFTNDRFGITLRCPGSECRRVAEVLSRAGALEVRREAT
jgi:hypothetical protein